MRSSTLPKLARCRGLLGIAQEAVAETQPPASDQAEAEAVTEESRERCPVCRAGRMQPVEVMAPARVGGVWGGALVNCSRLDTS